MAQHDADVARHLFSGLQSLSEVLTMHTCTRSHSAASELGHHASQPGLLGVCCNSPWVDGCMAEAEAMMFAS